MKSFQGFEAIASKFPNAKINGASARAWCPVHQGDGKSRRENRTLSMRETANGAIQIVCFAGCVHRDILAAVGMHYIELLPDHLRHGYGRAPHIKPKFEGWPCLQVLDSVLTEINVCRICANKSISGQPLDRSDYDILRRAHYVLSEAAQRVSREVRHG